MLDTAVVAVDSLMYQMLAGAIRDVRQVRDSPSIYRDGRILQDSLRSRVPPWRRGEIINSAAYINDLNLNGKWSLPREAVSVARKILEAEAAYQDELQAASVAGVPWEGAFGARFNACIRCGGVASWRFILKPPPGMPAETAWRLARPENAVPICRRCVEVTEFNRREDVRYDLVWGLWTTRFEALHRWYLAVQYGWLPAGWSREEHPLWPGEYGGDDWKNGSGSYFYSSPRPPRGLSRASVHFSALNRAMGVRSKRRGKNGPYFSALQLFRVDPDQNLGTGDYYCERGCIYRGTGSCSCCSRSRDSDPRAG